MYTSVATSRTLKRCMERQSQRDDDFANVHEDKRLMHWMRGQRLLLQANNFNNLARGAFKWNSQGISEFLSDLSFMRS
jgi:hypothetical protein